jgi:acetolactate synthase-1/2/3 large subunit
MSGQNNLNNKITGGEVIANFFKQKNIDSVACLAGTAHTHLLFALETIGIQIISSRHETATVAIADGYSRVLGKPGVALIKADQGMPNAMTGIITANQACSPVIILASLSPDSKREANDEWSNDWLDIVKPFVKWARVVPDPSRIDEFLNTAFIHSSTGRPGVSVLGIPQHFESAIVKQSYYKRDYTFHTSNRPDVSAIEEVARVLMSAEKPIILAGTGAALSNSGEILNKIVNEFSIPILANSLGRGLVPEDMELSFSWPLAQIAAKDADVILAVGIRLTQRLGYGLAPRFNPDAKFIQIDIHPEEIGRNRYIDIPLNADARLSLESLYKELNDKGMVRRIDNKWIHQVLESRLKRIDEVENQITNKIHPYHLARELVNQMPDNSIYVGDGADIQNWMHAILRIKREKSFLDHYPLGSMGIGTPLAIGAAVAAKEKGSKDPVVLVTGDGAFGFYAAELNALAISGIKIICIISNDGAWGTEKHGQINSLGRSINCELGQWDYHLIADVFGGNGEKVSSIEQLKPALERAFASDNFSVINVMTDPMAGLMRKKDPRLQMIAFEDLVTSLETHYTPEIA